MKLISEFRKSTPLPDQQRLVSARNRLVAAAVKERSVGAAPSVRLRRSRRRFVWPSAVTVGLAAAISGVVTLAPFDEAGVPAPTANADAVQVLHNAAAAALKLPDTPPRPDQFFYSKSQNLYGVREAWLSADGTHDGLVMQYGEPRSLLPGCRDGKKAATKGGEFIPGKFENCKPSPHYIPDLPTDADGMLTYLKKNSRDPNDGYHLGTAIQNMVNESYVRPQSMAALFEAAAKIPGITVVKEVKDPIGRPGIGISFPGSAGTDRQMLIFDRHTYAFLGSEFGATLEMSIVDRTEQRP
ncbi:CU044_5270 family protein [Saccharopolyspora sp. 5N708]|uniref:CU044_5270 family protein n=1 Tax=Saccharopolyspora sp. 5N708 TaxID=3457424 RepID=UPI003FD66B66